MGSTWARAILAGAALALGACGGSSAVAQLTPTIGSAKPPEPAAEPETSDGDAASPEASASGTVVPAAPDRRGVMVVAVGPVAFTEDEHGRNYTEGGDTAVAARSLARLVYKRTKLRPETSEEVVAILAGDPPPSGAGAREKELADLRAGLTPDVDGAAAKALLQSLAGKVHARAFVLVSAMKPAAGEAAPPPNARLVRVDDVPDGVALRLDSATFTAVPPASPEADYDWPHVDDAVSALLGPELPRAPGPRKTAGPSDHLGDKHPPAPKKKDESKPFTESPIFWGIVGGVAALGLTAVVVSQTVDTSTGTVHVQGKVLP